MIQNVVFMHKQRQFPCIFISRFTDNYERESFLMFVLLLDGLDVLFSNVSTDSALRCTVLYCHRAILDSRVD